MCSQVSHESSSNKLVLLQGKMLTHTKLLHVAQSGMLDAMMHKFDVFRCFIQELERQALVLFSQGEAVRTPSTAAWRQEGHPVLPRKGNSSQRP